MTESVDVHKIHRISAKKESGQKMAKFLWEKQLFIICSDVADSCLVAGHWCYFLTWPFLAGNSVNFMHVNTLSSQTQMQLVFLLNFTQKNILKQPLLISS